MSAPRVGALFAGYGGIELALHEVLGAEPAWFSEIEPAPSRILAHHWPDVPNHGDITRIRWSDVEPVDIITGGFPCQDVSPAGKRAGLIRGVTRSGLWGAMATAVEALKPRLVIIENVRGLLSAKANSDVEQCPWCVGGAADGEPPLRALGAVLGDLADIGMDAAWVVVPASGVGAPHRRERVFVLAWPQSDPGALTWPQPDAGALSQHPDKRKAGGHGPTLADEVEHLLPTPAVNDMGASYTPETWDEWTERMKREHGNGNGHGASLHIEALRMLPAPRATDGTNGGPNQRGSFGDTHHTGTTLTDATVRQADRFGQYAPAIARWEALTRPAPDPTEPTGRDGAHRLSPRFVEWMMGLPAGWVTDVPGVSRNDALKALGNGVVPQQAAAALRWLTATAADLDGGAA